MQKISNIIALIIITSLFFFWYLVAYLFYDEQTAVQNVFTTDGCTLFMDGAWKKCCFEHDRAYWQGGSNSKRKDADRLFRDCVYIKSDNKTLSLVMYGIVRVAGTPFISVPWRWGYGWEFGRGYR